MSSQFLGDLNDFISPSQACIKPVPSKSETLIVSLDMGEEGEGPVSSSDPVTISLNDCLACSGCITSAESVLVSQQTYLQLYSILSDNHDALQAGMIAPKVVIVSVSPQSRTAVAARFGLAVQDATEKITSFLHQIGVNFVFDTNFGRDISLHECSLEFLEHFRHRGTVNVGPLPLICGACPGWICYAEKTQPNLIDNLSRVKSPQQIMGTISKYFFAPRVIAQTISPSHIFHVTVMPCYDKKLEASRPDFYDETFQTRDVDCVISTSELMKMIEERIGIDGFLNLSASKASAASLSLVDGISGNLLSHNGSGSGGYLEHVLRFAARQLFNVELHFDIFGALFLDPKHSNEVGFIVEMQRNSDYQDFILTHTSTGKVLLRFAKVYGFRNVQNLVRKMKSRKVSYDYVEVMACPGACLNGGGQLRPDPSSSSMTPKQNLDKMQEIYMNQCKIEPLTDPRIEAVYREWLGGFGSPLLRTNFRAVEKTLPTSNFSVQW